MVLAMALALLDAPLHLAAHHEDDHGGHHCAVCALAKGQVDSPGFSCALVAFELVEVVGPASEISLPVTSIVDLLPPGRAPPVSVVPSQVAG